jgi:hypothetical protein
MPEYAHCLDQEVTVHYPPTPRYPRGRVRDGVIARRQNLSRGEQRIHRYTVLFDNDQADTMIPPVWIKLRAQAALPV